MTKVILHTSDGLQICIDANDVQSIAQRKQGCEINFYPGRSEMPTLICCESWAETVLKLFGEDDDLKCIFLRNVDDDNVKEPLPDEDEEKEED